MKIDDLVEFYCASDNPNPDIGGAELSVSPSVVAVFRFGGGLLLL